MYSAYALVVIMLVIIIVIVIVRENYRPMAIIAQA